MWPAQISYLSNLGTARMVSLRYAPALEAYLEASALAERAGDWFALGGIAVNLALIYQRMGDANAALSALERGKTAMDRLRTPPPYKAQVLMRLRSVRAALQENPAERRYIEPRYEDAIEAARQTGDPNAEAAAWHLLGEEKMAAGELEQAEAPLGEALRLRRSYSPENLGFSYAALGALRLAQADRASGEERLQASPRGRGSYGAGDPYRPFGSGRIRAFASTGPDPRSTRPDQIGTGRFQRGRGPGESMERSGTGGAFPGDGRQCCHAARDVRFLRGSCRAARRCARATKNGR